MYKQPAALRLELIWIDLYILNGTSKYILLFMATAVLIKLMLLTLILDSCVCCPNKRPHHGTSISKYQVIFGKNSNMAIYGHNAGPFLKRSSSD